MCLKVITSGHVVDAGSRLIIAFDTAIVTGKKVTQTPQSRESYPQRGPANGALIAALQNTHKITPTYPPRGFPAVFFSALLLYSCKKIKDK